MLEAPVSFVDELLQDMLGDLASVASFLIPVRLIQVLLSNILHLIHVPLCNKLDILIFLKVVSIR